MEKEIEATDDDAFDMLEINKLLAKAQMPIYFKRFKKDFTKRKWVFLEEEFNIPITIDMTHSLGTKFKIPFPRSKRSRTASFKTPKGFH